MLVEAETKDGLRHSLLLQNAETVRLIGPAQSLNASDSSEANHQSADVKTEAEHGLASYQAVSVTELQVGQTVYLHLQGAARHTGISINETIIEK